MNAAGSRNGAEAFLPGPRSNGRITEQDPERQDRPGEIQTVHDISWAPHGGTLISNNV
jgi:hypothetical protein